MAKRILESVKPLLKIIGAAASTALLNWLLARIGAQASQSPPQKD